MINATHGLNPGIVLPLQGVQARFLASAGRTSTGGEITAWANQYGQATAATQTNPAKYPTLNAGAINGHDAIYFDGTDSLDLSFPTPVASPFYMYIVMQSDIIDSTFRAITDSTDGSNRVVFYQNVDAIDGLAKWVMNSGEDDLGGAVLNSNWNIHRTYWNTAPLKSEHSINGGTIHEGGLVPVSLTTLRLGEAYTGAEGFTGSIAEVIIADATADDSGIMNYLRAIYNL